MKSVDVYRRFGKRTLDLAASSIILVLVSPILLVILLLIRFTMGRPALFYQKRPGFRGRPFTILKFRTMTDQRDAGGNLLRDGQRLTGLGRFLRSTSLDELPELINVFKGDMSLVGPRPLLMEYLELYTPEQMRRHEVRPGITGWAQINGRNVISWEEKFSLDVWYVDKLTFWLDLKILLRTISSVLKREGIDHPGQATMKRFTGSDV